MARINANGDREAARFERFTVPPDGKPGSVEDLYLHLVVLTEGGRVLERTTSGWRLRCRLSCDLPTARGRLERAGWREVSAQ